MARSGPSTQASCPELPPLAEPVISGACAASPALLRDRSCRSLERSDRARRADVHDAMDAERARYLNVAGHVIEINQFVRPHAEPVAEQPECQRVWFGNAGLVRIDEDVDELLELVPRLRTSPMSNATARIATCPNLPELRPRLPRRRSSGRRAKIDRGPL